MESDNYYNNFIDDTSYRMPIYNLYTNSYVYEVILVYEKIWI